jgi:hypothetical protein
MPRANAEFSGSSAKGAKKRHFSVTQAGTSAGSRCLPFVYRIMT